MASATKEITDEKSLKEDVSNIDELIKGIKDIKVEEKNMKYKLERTEPYNIFYNKIKKAKKTTNTINFSDLLCPSLGELQCSLQLTMTVDLEWLCRQYKIHELDSKPLTILYNSNKKTEENIKKVELNNIRCQAVKCNHPFGSHHTKMGLYYYEDDSLRVVVSSANLNELQWTELNQNLWISPACPKLGKDQPDDEGCGPTQFKTDLLEYLNKYKLPILNEWIEIVKRTDFSDIKVFLITSVPGFHDATSTTCHINRVGSLLGRYCKIPKEENWQVIAQVSNVSSLGKSPDEWWTSSFLKSLTNRKSNEVEKNIDAAIIYPSIKNQKNNIQKNVSRSLSFCCTELWIIHYLHTWNAEKLRRSGVMPHTKSYCRINDDHSRMAYYLLTSANISKAAWGEENFNDQWNVKSYEAGVLFLPKLFNEKYFKIKKEIENNDVKIFPLMFDLPLEQYDIPYNLIEKKTLQTG